MYYTEEQRLLYEDYTNTFNRIGSNICFSNMEIGKFYCVTSKDLKNIFLFKTLGRTNSYIIVQFINISNLDETKNVIFNTTGANLNKCEDVTTMVHSLFRQKKLNFI